MLRLTFVLHFMKRFNLLLFWPDFHEHHPEVGSPKVESEKLSDLASRRKLSDVSRKTFDWRDAVTLCVKPLLDGLTQPLLHLETVQRQNLNFWILFWVWTIIVPRDRSKNTCTIRGVGSHWGGRVLRALITREKY
jgi:hypothetical protein